MATAVQSQVRAQLDEVDRNSGTDNSMHSVDLRVSGVVLPST